VLNVFLSAATLALYIRSEFTRGKSLHSIIDKLKKSIPFNLKGFLLLIRGRPMGFTRASTKIFKKGRLHFSNSLDNIDYYFLKIQNRFGVCGVKIWMNIFSV
jgi:ribosomal protein S3